jgi:hypothetical protein
MLVKNEVKLVEEVGWKVSGGAPLSPLLLNSS